MLMRFFFLLFFKFKKEFGIQKDSLFNNRNPTISDRMHCVLYVTQANQDLIEQTSVLENVRRHVDDLGKLYGSLVK